MKLIIGLGNPGKEYEKTRHNAGFRFVDFFCGKIGTPQFQEKKKFAAFISEGAYSGEKIILAKPQTFMNLSGQAVQKLRHFYTIELPDLWLVYDDVDLPLGQIRIRSEGSAGSHNGMRSVIELLGTENFPRLRIGIESRTKTAPRQQDLSSFVLHAFSKEEEAVFKQSLSKAAEALCTALEKGIKIAQETYNAAS